MVKNAKNVVRKQNPRRRDNETKGGVNAKCLKQEYYEAASNMPKETVSYTSVSGLNFAQVFEL